MAKVLLGPMAAEVRGQVGGVVFSRNTFGAYIRNNTSPVNPNTERQQTVRSGFGQAAVRWRDDTTPDERASWEQYALGTPLPNVFGLRQILSGNSLYIRYNAIAISEGLTPVDDGPATPGEAAMLIPTITGDTTLGILLTAFTPTPLVTADKIMILESALPVSQSRNFFNSPFTRVAFIDGDETLPFTLRVNTTVAIGQRWFYQFRILLADGRVGPKSIFRIDILA